MFAPYMARYIVEQTADAANTGSVSWIVIPALIAVLLTVLLFVRLNRRKSAATLRERVHEVECSETPLAEPELMAAIGAALAATLDQPIRIVSIRHYSGSSAPGVESVSRQWALEGRRQIYSSHKVR